MLNNIALFLYLSVWDSTYWLYFLLLWQMKEFSKLHCFLHLVFLQHLAFVNCIFFNFPVISFSNFKWCIPSSSSCFNKCRHYLFTFHLVKKMKVAHTHLPPLLPLPSDCCLLSYYFYVVKIYNICNLFCNYWVEPYEIINFCTSQ